MIKSLENKKVAIIGNMNNTGFVILRYFISLGVDTELLLPCDEHANTLAHFRPQADTFEYSKWSKYIKTLSFARGWKSVFGGLFTLFGSPTASYLRKVFSEYDYIIGAGMMPAILNRAGLKLTIFVPYSTGIEYYGNLGMTHLLNSSNPLLRFVAKQIRDRQACGIKRCRNIVNAELGLTEKSLHELKMKSYHLPLLSVYIDDIYYTPKLPAAFAKKVEEIKKFDYIIMHHARLMWNNPGIYSDKEFTLYSKNNNFLVEAFARMLQDRKVNSCLVILEYGPDIDATKHLCKQLGINDRVIWLPQMERKYLWSFLKLADVIAGEFCCEQVKIWGATGWEALAVGKPLLQSFNYSTEEFISSFGCAPPPILHSYNADDVYFHLVKMVDDIDYKELLGKKSQDWFKENNSYSLAKKWLELLN